MTAPRPSETADTSFRHDLLYAARYYLGGRRGLLVLAGLTLLAGMAFGWSWFAAVGIAPLLLAILPCAAMCALGLCMNREDSKSCSSHRKAAESSLPESPPSQERGTTDA